jgi:hypothetical protein
MYSMAGSAHALESSIQNLQANLGNSASMIEALGLSDSDVEAALNTLSSVLDPVPHILEGTPTRAIIIAAVVSRPTSPLYPLLSIHSKR